MSLANEIDRMVEMAYLRGVNEGRVSSYNDGYNNGYDDGYDIGYEKGFDDALKYGNT